MSDNINSQCGNFRLTEEFPNFDIDSEISEQFLRVFTACLMNGRVIRFTRLEMRYDLIRYITFCRFPSTGLDVRDFVTAGLYYSSFQDIVVCYCCGFRRGNWQASEVPTTIHRQYSPNCSFYRTNFTENNAFSNISTNNFRGPFQTIPSGPSFEPPSSFLISREGHDERIEYCSILPSSDLPGQSIAINHPLEEQLRYTFQERFYVSLQLMSQIDRSSEARTINREQFQLTGELPVVPETMENEENISDNLSVQSYFLDQETRHLMNAETSVKQDKCHCRSAENQTNSSLEMTTVKTVHQSETQRSAGRSETDLNVYQRLTKRAQAKNEESKAQTVEVEDSTETERVAELDTEYHIRREEIRYLLNDKSSDDELRRSDTIADEQSIFNEEDIVNRPYDTYHMVHDKGTDSTHGNEHPGVDAFSEKPDSLQFRLARTNIEGEGSMETKEKNDMSKEEGHCTERMDFVVEDTFKCGTAEEGSVAESTASVYNEIISQEHEDYTSQHFSLVKPTLFNKSIIHGIEVNRHRQSFMERSKEFRNGDKGERTSFSTLSDDEVTSLVLDDKQNSNTDLSISSGGEICKQNQAHLSHETIPKFNEQSKKVGLKDDNNYISSGFCQNHVMIESSSNMLNDRRQADEGVENDKSSNDEMQRSDTIAYEQSIFNEEDIENRPYGSYHIVHDEDVTVKCSAEGDDIFPKTGEQKISCPDHGEKTDDSVRSEDDVTDLVIEDKQHSDTHKSVSNDRIHSSPETIPNCNEQSDKIGQKDDNHKASGSSSKMSGEHVVFKVDTSKTEIIHDVPLTCARSLPVLPTVSSTLNSLGKKSNSFDNIETDYEKADGDTSTTNNPECLDQVINENQRLNAKCEGRSVNIDVNQQCLPCELEQSTQNHDQGRDEFLQNASSDFNVAFRSLQVDSGKYDVEANADQFTKRQEIDIKSGEHIEMTKSDTGVTKALPENTVEPGTGYQGFEENKNQNAGEQSDLDKVAFYDQLEKNLRMIMDPVELKETMRKIIEMSKCSKEK